MKNKMAVLFRRTAIFVFLGPWKRDRTVDLSSDIQIHLEKRSFEMTETKEKAGFICVKDTLDGAYPSLVWG